MIHILSTSSVLLFLLLNVSAFGQKNIEYPVPPKGDFVDNYFDEAIEDPYQWMEDPTDPRLIEWLEQQKKITKKVENKQTRMWTLREQIGSMYWAVEDKKTKDFVREKSSEAKKYRYRYRYNRIDRSPDLTYRRNTDDFEHYKLLVKGKDFRNYKDENLDIKIAKSNDEEHLVAISIARNGSDWKEIYIYDLLTREKLSDKLLDVRFTGNICWHGRNLYYAKYDTPTVGRELLDPPTGQKLYYHILGTAQEADKLLYTNLDLTDQETFHFSELDDRLFIYHYLKSENGTVKSISVSDMDPDKFEMKNFFNYPNDEEIKLYATEVMGDSVLLETNWYAPNGRILLANVNEPNKADEFIPEYDVRLRQLNKFGKDKLAGTYSGENFDVALIFDNQGTLLKKIAFPEGKRVHGFWEKITNIAYTQFSVSAFYHPDLDYQISLSDFSIKPMTKVSVPYDAKSIETRYIKYKSKDGTEIPMFITCLKNTKLNGKNPTLIYGYGGYGHTIEPNFNEEQALFVLHGGILAIPNIRGGGAKGDKWGLEGRRLKKQNGIDDFIGAAEYLISEKYTNSEKIGINGGSHGGLLVAAAITQRPELYKAAVIEAGALDMLRFEKFTVGNASLNLLEFGSVKDSSDFNNLLSYSPLHNIRKGVKYPQVLLISGAEDDRVPPLHSYKFLATLQEKGDPSSLYHLSVIDGASHSGALTQEDWISKKVFKYYFLFDQLGLRFY